MQERGCLFCAPDPTRAVAEDKTTIALWDAYPLAPGHALVVPRRHAPSWFDLTDEEQQAMLAAAGRVRQVSLERHGADGFNLGINDGEAAGQTVGHVHLHIIHIIPRRVGDVADPCGGVRRVLPERAAYWEEP